MAALDGLAALVTGAGGGIGAAIARELARAGATVVVNDVDGATAAATAGSIGPQARAHAADVSDPDAAAGLVAAASEHGRLDVLINCAGILGRARVADMSDEEWRRVLAVNLDGCFHTCRAAVPLMERAGFGRIVNVASIAGIRISYVGSAAYTASKAGLIGFTRHLAVEVAPAGITVNAVLPGVTATPLLEGADLDALAASIPAGRAATPEDHAALVAFLAGPAPATSRARRSPSTAASRSCPGATRPTAQAPAGMRRVG
jgi:NAD(P)-dependent dehydrogenase (short-subunit alcohol dehydrogenase family)